MASNCNLVVLISGSGSNLQALIDTAAQGAPYRIAAVISNRAEAYGLQRAAEAQIPHRVLNHREFSSREAYDQALMALIDQHQPKAVVLAGFMRILTPAFTSHYRGRLFNIHPSLLPKYQGLHTHARAIAAEDEAHGASVHFVTEELDGGPLIAQARVQIEPEDDADTLAARVLKREHFIYPLCLRWFAEKRLELAGNNQVWFESAPLAAPITFNFTERN